ncbi:MAG: glycosyltransferase family 39 protein [Bacteroidia bacterium]
MSKKQKTAPAKSSGAKKQSPAKPGFLRRNVFSVALVVITFLVFGNGIFNKYALDDEFYTAGSNKLTQKGIKAIPEIFTSRTFYNNDGSGYSYRPVTVASFAIEIQLFGEKPEVSHFINVLLYALTVVLLFRLLRRWFSAQGDWFSFFIALLFLVHPLHTEPVDNIKCRDELLAILFGVSSMFFLWRFRESGKWFYMVLFPLCFFAGMLAKATIMPFYLLIPMALWFFTDLKISRIALYMAPLVLAAVCVLLIKNGALPESVREFQSFENPITAETSFATKSATAAHVLGRYLWLHIFPHPLVYYYGQNYVSLVSWSDPLAIAAALIHLALLVIALRGLRTRSILSFGILFYLINIIFYSNLISPAPGLMAERFAYMAGLGFCIVVVWGVFKLTKLAPEMFRWGAAESSRARFVLLGVAAVFSIRSVVRNTDWQDKHTLYINDMEHLGESAKANMLLGSLLSADGARINYEGNMLIESGKNSNNITVFNAGKAKRDSAQLLFRQSRDYYLRATEISPQYYTAWSNLGTTYFFGRDFASAKPCLLRSVSIKPDYTEGLFNLGVTYDSLRMPDSAMFYLRRCIATDSAYAAAYDPLVKLMLRKDSTAEPAIEKLLSRARFHSPKSDMPLTAMMNIRMMKKDTVGAVAYMDQASELNPTNQMRMYQLSVYYQNHGNPERASYWQGRLAELQRANAKKSKNRRAANQ